MKKLIFATMFIILLAACSQTDDSYETIGLDDVLTYEQQGYQIVDVREKGEFNAGHIPTASNLPLSEIEAGNFGELSKQQQYVIICRSGNRSQTASALLHEQGYKVVNVNDGMGNWTGEITK